MSRVFVATESALDRQVVLKVLPPELAHAVSVERFRQEIRLAAKLQHPHIVPLLAAGDAGTGLLYYSMPFVEGESLRVRLTRSGELTLKDAIRILRDVASALAYAHERGLVHRDIKPDNVMLSGGEALVTDFGVAKALSASASGGDSGLTSLGVALGTPTYMAPEQGAADPNTDHRADLYAWGCLAYECLTGQPPFAGRTPAALLAAHATQTPEPIAARRATLPPALADLVMRCLQKRPADRPQSANELLQGLEGILTPSGGTAPTMATVPTGPRTVPRFSPRARLALGALALIVALGAGALVRRMLSGRGASDSRRLAVLPFDNLGAPTDEYFADGISDAVRGKLSTVPGMEVMARASSNQYRHSTKPLAEIGRELGVRYLLTGTVRWERNANGGSRIQVNPELVEVPAGTARWQAPFDAALTDVFQVQADVASRVAEALGVALETSQKNALTDRPTHDLAAYDAFLRGERILITQGQIDPLSMREATASYREAVRRDSNFALAWARLARSTSLQYGNGDDDDSIARLAKHAVDRALALAPDRAESYVALGSLRPQVLNDLAGGIDALEHARVLAPRDPDVLSLLGLWLRNANRFDESVACAAEAARLDPRSAIVLRRYSAVLSAAGHFEAADSVARIGVTLVPDNLDLRATIIWARLALGDSAGARVATREMMHTSARRYLPLIAESGAIWLLDDSVQTAALTSPPDSFSEHRRSQGLVALGAAHWELGHPAVARAYADSAVPLIEAELSQNPADDRARKNLALAYTILGRRRDAIAESERVFAGWSAETRATRQGERAGILMRIDLMTGNPAGAVAWLDSLLRISPGWGRGNLRVDPLFAPLRGRPDFQRLARSAP